MYYDDFSIDSYYYLPKPFTVKHIGWLDSQHPFPKGEVSEKFLTRLAIFCKEVTYISLCYHECEFCEPIAEYEFPDFAENKIIGRSLGTSEFLVFDNKDTFYLAPDLIYHYILTHKYQPPEEFIRAVLESPLPDTVETFMQKTAGNTYKQ